MAKQTTLEVKPRTVLGKSTKHLRKEGLIPANIYGHKEAPLPLQVDEIEFARLQRAHGARNVVSLHLPDDKTETVLIRHVQHNPVSGKILHVDFTRVSLRERIESKIPLKFTGVALGVKNEGGVLLHLVDALAVECAASDIVEDIEVDISELSEIDATLYARDVKLPKGYELVTDPEEPIVKVAASRIEAELPEATEAAPAEDAPAPAKSADTSTEA